MSVDHIRDGATAALLARKSPFPENAKSLSVVHGQRTIAVLALQWLCIIVLVVLAEHTGLGLLHWLAVGLVVIAIASRQQALAVLMHEAAHYRLFRRRSVNDAVSDLFCALPLGLVTCRYRQTHLAHHLEPLSKNDPDWMIMQANPREWSWPKTSRESRWTLLRDVSGIGFIAFIRQWNAWLPLTNHFGKVDVPEPFPRRVRIQMYLFYVVVTVLVFQFGLWQDVALYWILPLVTISQFMFRVRTVSEHLGCGQGSGMAYTRNVEAGWIERLLISPLNVGHHLTHHLFPGVPWYNLPKMTSLLHDDPNFRAAAYVS